LREYDILKSLQASDYIVKLNDQFFLTEELEAENDQSVVQTKNSYFVSETEICDGNVAEYLAYLRKNSIILEDRVK